MELARRCMPPLDGPPTILDLFEGVGDTWTPGMFVRVVQTAWDSWWIVGHCNVQSVPVTKTVDVTAFPPLPGGGTTPPDPTMVCSFNVHDQSYVGGLSDHNQVLTFHRMTCLRASRFDRTRIRKVSQYIHRRFCSTHTHRHARTHTHTHTHTHTRFSTHRF